MYTYTKREGGEYEDERDGMHFKSNIHNNSLAIDIWPDLNQSIEI